MLVQLSAWWCCFHGWYGWQRVGWTVAAVDLAAATVTFTRPGGAA